MSAISTVIFDCFGVLATEGWIPFRDQMFGHDDKKLLQANDMMNALSIGMITPDDFMQRMSDFSGLTIEDLRPVFYENAPNATLFAWIKERQGRYRFSVLSNISAGRFEEIFPANLRALFDDLALSYSLGFAKPDARAYQFAMERLGVVSSECLFVDDQAKNVAAAESLGMAGITYVDQAQFEHEAKKLLH